MSLVRHVYQTFLIYLKNSALIAAIWIVKLVLDLIVTPMILEKEQNVINVMD